MPTYIRRPHDELLWGVLDPGVAASRRMVVRGGSSTGKTRAAYEAVADRLSDWQVDYPLTAAALAARLDAGIPAHTVLWLGDLRQYADADGGAAVLGLLADLLEVDGYMVITTLWPEHWNAYIGAARAGPGAADPAGVAGRLLARLPDLTGRDPAQIDPARGGVIDVPPRFTISEVRTAARTGDPVLAAAVAAAADAGQDGQVTQYLAGVPDLLRHYDGPGGDPHGQAVITAAMDATRLGHASPLPVALLRDAAVGYLTGPQRTSSIESWCDTALAWATAELNGAVQALQPIPPAAGTGVVGYQIADYLDQHGRRTRQDQLGPPSLWDALGGHATTASDLIRLAQAARDRGLYRHAAAFWTTAATLGNTDAARQLVAHLRRVSPGDAARAAQWAINQVNVDDPGDATFRLWALRAAGADDAVTALLARDTVGHVRLDEPLDVALLLEELRVTEAGDAVTALLARDPFSRVSLDNPQTAAELLRALHRAGAADAVTAMATRAVSRVSLDNPQAVASLLRALRRAGAADAVTALATRAVSHASLDNPQAVASLLQALLEIGARDAVKALLARDPFGHASLDNPQAVASMLQVLRRAGASGAITALLARDPASNASLDNPQAVASLLRALLEIGARDAVKALLARDPFGHASLDNPQAVALLLKALRETRAKDAIVALLARDPASNASLDNPQAVASLLRELRVAGATDASHTLADRAANAGMFDLFLEVRPDKASSYRFGREPDGLPSQPWSWQQPPN